jgi:choline-sulfatase
MSTLSSLGRRAANIPVLGLLLLSSLRPAFAGSQSRTPVILISIDTLRADHLSSYGYRFLDTKNIDRLAKGGTLFTSISSQVPLTLPSHVSLLTSTYPFSNGVEDNGEVLGPEAVTLAGVLKGQGYSTAAFTGGFVLDRRFGLNQGFDYYDSPFHLEGQEGINLEDLKRTGEAVVRSATRWLDVNASKPFFIFVHLFDLHTPYERHRGILRGGYDAEITYVDRTLGQFWAYLERKGLFDKALIVLLADHGESLGEHGEQTHGFFIYQSTIHVPLIIHWPRRSPAYPSRVSAPASLIDVAPTILQSLHLSVPPQFQGKSLLALMDRNAPGSPREVYSESLYAHNHYGCSPLRGLQVGQYQYIDAPKREFYDLARDPRELDNLYGHDRALALAYQQRLLSLKSRFVAVHQATPKGLSPAVVERLSSLGYLAVTGSHPANADAGADPKDMIVPYQETHRAIALAYSGQMAEAAALLAQVLARYPELTDTRNILGMYQMKLGRNAAAAESFRDVLKEDPASILAHLNLGRAYARIGRFNDAVREFKAVLAIGSDSPAYQQVTIPAQEMLGTIWIELKNYPKAKAAFESLLAADPYDYIAHFNLGWLAASDGNFGESERQLRMALATEPKSAEAHNALGAVYLRENKLDEARQELETATRLDPKFARAYYNLGMVFAKQGNSIAAAEQFRKTLRLDPQFNAARQQLRSLGNDDGPGRIK